jgi:hypothetical protein
MRLKLDIFPWILGLCFLLPAPLAQAEKLTEVQAKHLQALIAEAKLAKTAKDLEKVADLLSQAIAIKADPSFRWNLARIYEGLCMFPGASEQFSVLAKDRKVAKEIRERAELRARGLVRYLAAATYRVDLKPEAAKLFIDGKSTSTESGHIRFYSLEASNHVAEMFVPGGWRTRVRFVKADLKRCLSVDDDLEALPPGMARLRLRGTVELASLEINRYRVRADLAKLQDVETTPGEFKIEARTSEGVLLTATAVAGAGETVDVKLVPVARELPELIKTPVLGETPKPSGASSGYGLWGWVSAGIGLSLAGGGAVMLVVANADSDSLNNDLNSDVLDSLSQETTFLRRDNIEGDAAVGAVVVSLGAAVAVTGLLLLLLDDGELDTKSSADVVGWGLHVFPGANGSVQMGVTF